MRKTKIICTLGPATGHTDVLRQLIEQGTDMFRLNMSHADHRSAREVVPRIRQLAEEARRPVAILLDTQGPAIRTGDLKINLDLKADDILELTVGDAESEEPYSVHVNYDGLVDDVAVGDTVLVDNGMIRLVVLEKRGKRIRCKVITPGTLGSRRHINLPGVHVNLPPLTEKDLADISLGADLGVDFVALSFVRQKSDLDELRGVLFEKRSKALIIAKIEDQLAVRAIADMINGADAIMIARGDLGIECPMEELPIIQRRIVKCCIRLGKPVIVATQMLESMIINPLPTRAEITDVANAVFERAKIVVFTRHGTMARNVSNLRPENAPIFAFTSSEEVRRQLAICWGVCPVRIDFTADPNVTIEAAEKLLREAKLTAPGDHLVIISDVRAGDDRIIDSVQLRTVK